MANHTVLASSFLVLGALSGASSADAATLRCGNSLVSSGESMYEVRSVCGEPDQATTRTEFRTVRLRGRCSGWVEHTVEVTIDEWLYDFGRRRFIEYVTFEQGRMVRVTTGTYGRKP